MPSNLLDIISLVTTFVASFFLLKSGLGLTDKMILKLASTNQDYSDALIDSFLKQSCDTYIGAGYLFLAFSTQILSINSRVVIDKQGVTEIYIFVSLGFGVLLCLLGIFLSNLILSIRKKKIDKIRMRS